MIQLSAVVITYNEEKNIERCIQSLKKVADEIVVVDSFSTDGTEKICRSLKVKFVQHKFQGHIQQKNFAITQTTNKWVLSVDADEMLSDELTKSILSIKQNPQFDGYFMNRLNNYCGQWIKYCGWYPDKKLRLWNSGKGKWQGENPHDEFVMNENCSTGFLQGDLLHYTIASVEAHQLQIEKFTTIAAQQLFAKHKNTNWFFIYSSTAFRFLKDYFFRLGFLDGYYGLMICRGNARYNFLKYSKLLKLNSTK